MTPACRAAADIAAKYGIRVDDPLLLQETNNTVVWLRPSDVIAKVGTRAENMDELQREYEVARALAALDAPVASPLVEAPPTTDPRTGFIVTLWNRLERDESIELPASAVGESLGELHDAMNGCRVELPDFRVDIRRSRRILQAPTRIPALAAGDRAFLEEVFDALLPAIEAAAFDSRPLHGEPHEGNRVPTPFGIRWIDFESACRGPVEWDLAFLPEEARRNFSKVDEDLLAVFVGSEQRSCRDLVFGPGPLPCDAAARGTPPRSSSQRLAGVGPGAMLGRGVPLTADDRPPATSGVWRTMSGQPSAVNGPLGPGSGRVGAHRHGDRQ